MIFFLPPPKKQQYPKENLLSFGRVIEEDYLRRTLQDSANRVKYKMKSFNSCLKMFHFWLKSLNLV